MLQHLVALLILDKNITKLYFSSTDFPKFPKVNQLKKKTTTKPTPTHTPLPPQQNNTHHKITEKFNYLLKTATKPLCWSLQSRNLQHPLHTVDCIDGSLDTKPTHKAAQTSGIPVNMPVSSDWCHWIISMVLEHLSLGQRPVYPCQVITHERSEKIEKSLKGKGKEASM